MDKPPEYNSADYVPYKGIARTPGQTIKALREMHEWSQADLANKTGIARTVISSLEAD